MRTISSLVVFVFLAAASTFNSPIASACSKDGFGYRASSCEKKIQWRFDTSLREFQQDGVVRAGRADGREYEYELNDRCGNSVDCGAAAPPWPDVSGVPGRMYQAWAFLLKAGGGREAGIAPRVSTVIDHASAGAAATRHRMIVSSGVTSSKTATSGRPTFSFESSKSTTLPQSLISGASSSATCTML